MEVKHSEQEILRRQKMEELKRLGIDPYPAGSVPISTNSKIIIDNYDTSPEKFQNVSLAGRIMSRRIMGSASFVELMDCYGKIQLYFHRDSLCPMENKNLYDVVFKKLLDIGDIINIRGYGFKTKVGQISIHVEKFKILSKSLKPLPIVKETQDGNEKKTYDAFTNPEAKYRQRYVDLIVNPEVNEVFQTRSIIIKEMREFFDNLNCLEVETPILQSLYGGALAKPFVTHHNTLDIDLYLRIAPELYLKRLIVGNNNGVYEIGKAFRNEGMSRFHNPEFTILEAYIAYKDYYWMMGKIESMLERISILTNGKNKIEVGKNIINFGRPWKRYTLFEVIKKFTGIDISNLDEDELVKVCQDINIKTDPSMAKAKLIDEIFGQKCEPYLINPTFITDYPVEMSPLAKKHKDNPKLVERFEIICNGKEICNSYSELNDPIEQKERFLNQIRAKQKGDEESMLLDNDFINALEYGMPPTVGVGIGIDRLTMTLTNSASIQDVILFPQMKPKI